MSDDTARAVRICLVALTSKSENVRMKPNRNKIINKYKRNKFDDINTSPFELSTYKII